MVIYEVNLSIEAEIGTSFEHWLRAHVADMLEFDGFESAAWYWRKAENEGSMPDGRILWTIHYSVRDRDALDAYLDGTAEEKRERSLDKFRGYFSATRRILLPRR